VLTLTPAATGASNVFFYSNLALNTTNVSAGTYSLCAEMSAGPHTRYLYAPEMVQIISPPPTMTISISQSGSRQLNIGINGTAGQTIVLQSSTNLVDWTAVGTNALTTSLWNYTNGLPGGPKFYRAMVLQ
jgi:hypothetical protein